MKDSKTMGLAVGFGIIIGTVIFALTGEAFWIAIGIIIGASSERLPRRCGSDQEPGAAALPGLRLVCQFLDQLHVVTVEGRKRQPEALSDDDQELA